jgi:hypothetical protein
MSIAMVEEPTQTPASVLVSGLDVHTRVARPTLDRYVLLCGLPESRFVQLPVHIDGMPANQNNQEP